MMMIVMMAMTPNKSFQNDEISVAIVARRIEKRASVLVPMYCIHCLSLLAAKHSLFALANRTSAKCGPNATHRIFQPMYILA